MKNEVFRNKVTWFSFGFSLLVIWVHSYNAELYLGQAPEMEVVYRLQHAVGEGIGQIAVPGFFMISGYLFYRDFTWKRLGEKWQRRIRSVLVPYILWNFLYYLGYVIGSRLPWMTDVVGKGVIPFGLLTAVDAVINYTYNYVFWYLFQLILLILLAPVLYPLLRHRGSRAGLFVALWWMIAAGVTLPLVNTDALLYYSVAASLALSQRQWVEEEQEPKEQKSAGQKQETEKRNNNSERVVPGYREVKRVLCGVAFLAAFVLLYRLGLRMAWIPCFVLCRLLAVAGLWMAVPGRCLPAVRGFMCHNFYLYGVHFALVRFINKAGTRILPAVPEAAMLLYLLMPVLILMIADVSGRVLRRYAPVLWMLLNGGR